VIKDTFVVRAITNFQAMMTDDDILNVYICRGLTEHKGSKWNYFEPKFLVLSKEVQTSSLKNT